MVGSWITVVSQAGAWPGRLGFYVCVCVCVCLCRVLSVWIGPLGYVTARDVPPWCEAAQTVGKTGRVEWPRWCPAWGA